MKRIRSIKPGFFTSQKIGRMSVIARLSLVGLILEANDQGRGIAEPRYLLNKIHPFAKDVSPKKFTKALDEISELKTQDKQGNEIDYCTFWKDGHSLYYQHNPIVTGKHPWRMGVFY